MPKNLPVVSPKGQARECGPCSLCCDLFPVPELQKDSGARCRWCEPPHGCAIHTSRPAVCRSFDCAWLRGAGTDAERPDLVRLFIAGTARLGGRLGTLCYAELDAVDVNLPRLRELAARTGKPVFVLAPPLDAGWLVGCEVTIEPSGEVRPRPIAAASFSWLRALPAEPVL